MDVYIDMQYISSREDLWQALSGMLCMNLTSEEEVKEALTSLKHVTLIFLNLKQHPLSDEMRHLLKKCHRKNHHLSLLFEETIRHY